jgi:hypothetical protein
MFTGFPSENTPAIQVWDSFRVQNGSTSNSIYLTDDCAPIQLFRTGGNTSSAPVTVYLPTAPIDGKSITILNQGFSFYNQKLQIRSASTIGGGANTLLYTLGVGGYLTLVFSKQCISVGDQGQASLATGWLSLTQSSRGAYNSNAVVIGSDNSNAAEANCAVIGGSQNNAASNSAGVFAGDFNNANGQRSVVVGGQSNSTNGAYAGVLAGQTNAANGAYAGIVGGTGNFANSNVSGVFCGSRGTTRSINGYSVFPASETPIAVTSGLCQSALLVLARQTTNATATRLTSDAFSASTINQLILPNNSAYYFKGSMVAGVTGGANSAMWSFEGGIERGANAASTTIIQSVINPVAADTGASSWIFALSADTTNGGLAVTVTGAAATTIRWVCKIETTEMTF